MDLQASRKRQLAAAVTLAVMGMAWMAMPQQAWAADVGNQDNPMKYSTYVADENGAIKKAREQKTGEDLYAAQYHENFGDVVYGAKGDMQGKNITLDNMTVEGIANADNKGGAAGAGQNDHDTSPGLAGGIASAVGIYSSDIFNAKITFGDIEIKAIGGAPGKGGVGEYGGKNTGVSGGIGTNGGAGGLALATGIDIVGSNNTITGGVLKVTATGTDGGVGGTGGTGGSGANGTPGSDGGTGGAGSNGGNVTAENTAGNPGGQGGQGGDGLAGTAGGNGGRGSYGGSGGAGSAAKANGLRIADSISVTSVSLNGLVVTATAGNGGNGADGGVGGQGGIGGNGGNGGQGGTGGQGSNPSPADGSYNAGNGGQGGTGGNGGNGGQGGAGGFSGHGGFGGVGGNAAALGLAGTNSVLDLTVAGDGIKVTATGGNGGKAGLGGVGGAGGAGGAGGNGGAAGLGGSHSQSGANAADGQPGQLGTAGTGGQGGTGGLSNWAGANDAGGTAKAEALTFSNASQVTLKTGAITAEAKAGLGVGSFNVSDEYVAKTGNQAVTDNTGGDPAGVTGGAGGQGLTPSLAAGGSTNPVPQSSNGATAEALALKTVGGTLNVLSDAGLAIIAKAKDAATTNTAEAVVAENTAAVYNVKGNFEILADATGDQDITNGHIKYDSSSTETASTAQAVQVTGGSMLVNAGGKVDITAGARDNKKSDNTNHTVLSEALAADGAVIDIRSGAAMTISAQTDYNDSKTNRDAHALTATNGSTLNFAAAAGGIKVISDDGDNDYAAKVENSTATFDAGTDAAGIGFQGKTTFKDSVLNLKSDTAIASVGSSENKGALDISGTTMNLTDNLSTLTVADKTSLKGSTVYFYNENDQADKYNTFKDYRTISTKDLDASDTNEFFMRTNATGAYGGTAGEGDKIVSTNTATGNGTYEISVFDQGMRNGYNNIADADGNHIANNSVTLIENAQASGAGNATYNIKEMQYDNGIWAYEYAGEAEVVDGSLDLTKVTTKAVNQSVAQWAAQDANKIAAGAAVTLFGADETLMERLGDVRNSADDNDGVWAKYVGGKIKVDGLKGDNDFKYNGFAAGYDHEIGSNWRLGLAGQYAKGDTALSGGDGEIKTAAGALYGTWTGDKGHHVDIIAKVGKVDSETSAYGGTIAQKLDGDFSSTAMSFAVEYGYRQDLNDGWFVEPMVRASYVHLGGDDYTVTTRDGSMNVTNDAMNSIVLRGGFLLGKNFAEASNVYLKAAVLHDFDGDINTKVSADGRTASYSDSIGGTAIEYGIGVNHKFNKDSSMYFDVERISGGDVTKNWGVNVGFRYSF
ncbi:autotransporter outer membrane beta-barrel domain-containing protein [Phascolarctobacterium sp.]